MRAWSMKRDATESVLDGRVRRGWAGALAILACSSCGAPFEDPAIESIESDIGAGVAYGFATRVSVSSNRAQGDLESTRPGVSRDGFVVGFVALATNLVAGDTNGFEDVFVRDRRTGTTERVSVSSDGAEGDQFSDRYAPALDQTGRFVAFESGATNFVPGDANGTFDVFLRDRREHTTVRVSLGNGGVEGNDFSISPAMSANARFVAFVSAASNLVPGDTNGFIDAFVRDRRFGTTSRVSVSTGGAQGNQDVISNVAVNDDGRFVAFSSTATNLVPQGASGSFVRDRQRGTTELVSISSAGVPGDFGGGRVSISADGRFVVYDSNSTNLVPNDTNGVPDVFVRDLQRGLTERVSLSSTGQQGSDASGFAAISADARFIAFGSSASNLVPGVTTGAVRTYIRDRHSRTTRLATRTFDGSPPNGATGSPALSGDGRVLVTQSLASNLIANDTNGVTDVFVQIGSFGKPHHHRH
jgi:hypothetical protein